MANGLKTALLLGALSAIFLFLGEALGGAQGLVVGFFFAVVMNFGSYWFSDKIVLAMYRRKPVGSGSSLYEIVADLAQRGGLPMPRVYVIPQPSPNAFATGRNRSTPPSRQPRASCSCSTTRSSPGSWRMSWRT